MARTRAWCWGIAALLGVLVLLCGCETRSISDSGYAGHGYGGRGNPFYRGEITEFDVLGIDVSQPATDEEIARQLAAYRKLGLRKGGSLMAIQSGALTPDDEMVKALERHFSVVPFTGVRLAEDSARGEARALICLDASGERP